MDFTAQTLKHYIKVYQEILMSQMRAGYGHSKEGTTLCIRQYTEPQVSRQNLVRAIQAILPIEQENRAVIHLDAIHTPHGLLVSQNLSRNRLLPKSPWGRPFVLVELQSADPIDQEAYDNVTILDLRTQVENTMLYSPHGPDYELIIVRD